MADRVGQQIGQYHFLRLVGHGGFAEVYLGEHILLKTQAAIKVLHTRLASNDIDSFLKEAQTIAHLDHAHIVRVLDFGVEVNAPYLVMEYAPHGTLRHRYPTGKHMPLSDIVKYVKQVASALQHAHNQRLIHRDIKPANMLLNKRDEAILSDFGIAVIAHSEASLITQQMAGTVPYMAPEQIEGKPQLASDQYALGIVVYEWLCGVRPFQGSQMEIITQHIYASPPSLDEKIPAVSPLIKEVVLKALAKNPHDRFASVQEFANALEQAYQPMQPTLQAPAFHAAPALSTPLPATEKVQQASSLEPSVGKLILRYSGHSHQITDMAWSPDGTRIASTSFDGTMQVWEVATRNIIFRCSFQETSDNYMTALAWSPHNSYIAFASSNSTVQIWDITKGIIFAKYDGDQNDYGYREKMDKLKWSPNGRALAFRGFYPYPFQNNIKIWSMDNTNNVFTYQGHHAEVLSFAWSPDGKHIASSSRSVHVWDAATGGKVFIFHDISDWVKAVTWSPDGRYIASAGDDKTVQIWDTITGEEKFPYRGHARLFGGKIKLVAWSPHGQYIASASDKIIQVWDVTTGELIYIYRGHSGKVRTFVWSPDGQRLVSISGDNTVHLWYPFTEDTPFLYTKHSGRVQDMAWSPDGTRIASRSMDKTVQVWQAF